MHMLAQSRRDAHGPLMVAHSRRDAHGLLFECTRVQAVEDVLQVCRQR